MTKKTLKKKNEEEKKKKKRIINAHYRHSQPDHPTFSVFSLSLPFSLCSHSSITFFRLCNHTHTIIIICSRYARRARLRLVLCSNFSFPFLNYCCLLITQRKERKEREREREEKKSVCKLLKSFMNERIGAKKGKTRCSHTRRFPFFFFLLLSLSLSLLSLLFLFVAAIYFFYRFLLVLIVSNFGSAKILSLSFLSHRHSFIHSFIYK